MTPPASAPYTAAMPSSILLSLSALAALVPAALLPVRAPRQGPDLMFWAVIAAALAGPTVASLLSGGLAWRTGLSLALWTSIAASMALFIVVVLIEREAWRLAVLLLPYLLLLGVLATIWNHVPAEQPLRTTLDAWLVVHIVVSVATYGLCTLAAVAGASVLLQQHAVKHKHPTKLSRRLPSISDASRLQAALLRASALVLGLGIVTGMAEQYLLSGQPLVFNHKILLSLVAFTLIALLLTLHHRSGLRGQRAARLILVAYLLLTLAYPGVKFVTDVLLA